DVVCGLSRRQLDSLDSEALEVDELEVEPEDTFVDFLQVEEVIAAAVGDVRRADR
nr:hypothetical protein [Actinomycetota bacterium]